MKKLVIFGCTPYARLLRYTIEHDAQRPVAAYCLTRDYLTAPEFDGLPVLAFESLPQQFGADGFEVLITTGYKRMNTGREKIFRLCEENGYEIASFIHPSVKVDAEQLGRGNIIMEGSRLYPFTRLGDGNVLNGAVLGHETVMGNFNFTAKCSTGGLVQIGNNNFIGIGCCIVDNIRVGSYCLLGTATAISKNVEDHTVVMPAKNRTMQADIDAMSSLFQ